MEKHEFQAEIKQLLDIVVHSIYTDKEVFVRELISNAADACEKLRFLQASGEQVRDEAVPLEIRLSTDDTAQTITITDSGVGMTRDELVANLGTIARSGSKEFVSRVKDAAKKQEEGKAVDLIGQFGVGFYSCFMVAEKVEVFTRSYQPEGQGWKWTSDGAGGYEIDEADGVQRGTRIVVYLRDNETDKDFSRESRIEQIVKHYSNFVAYPIELNGKKINTVEAIWARSKSSISEDEYKEFYQYIGHAHDEPLYRLHFQADAPLAINALLFVPGSSVERMGMFRHESEVNLYCRRILIEPGAKDLFPDWLRFLKGVVDSEDLPLAISRESMQDSALLRKLNGVLTKRFLKMLQEDAKTDADKYAKFYKEFGHCLKEGVISDFEHKEELGKLLRFESSHTEAGKGTGLADYVSRMREGQEEIYYIAAANRAAAEAHPYYEVFKSRGYEVIFCFDARDEFVMDSLGEFDGKKLRSGEKADVSVEDKPQDALSEDDAKALCEWMHKALGQEKVKSVKVSERLTDSPAVALDPDPHITATMRRMLEAAQREGQAVGSPLSGSTPELEINPGHDLVKKLNTARESKPDLAKVIAEQIYDSAKIASGMLDDPREMLNRLNAIMSQALE